MSDFRIEGLRELERNLSALSKSAGKAAMRRALQKAADPLVSEMRQGVPVATGSLRDSIAISSRLAPRQRGIHRRMFRDARNSVEMFVGPSYKAGGGGRHAHLVEFGTGPRYYTTKKGKRKYVGSMPAQPFARPAWDRERKPLVVRLQKLMWDEVTRSLSRARRRARKLPG